MTTIKKLLLMISVLPLLVLFTNADRYSRTDSTTASSYELVKIDPDHLLVEIQSLFTKRSKGLYGTGEGDNLMLKHQNVLINMYAMETGVIDCEVLKKAIPSLNTGGYILGKGDLKKCIHNSNVMVSSMPFAM